MKGLYPIIRRVRRPLVLVDKPPVVAGNVQPVQPVAQSPAADLPAPEPPGPAEVAMPPPEPPKPRNRKSKVSRATPANPLEPQPNTNDQNLP